MYSKNKLEGTLNFERLPLQLQRAIKSKEEREGERGGKDGESLSEPRWSMKKEKMRGSLSFEFWAELCGGQNSNYIIFRNFEIFKNKIL